MSAFDKINLSRLPAANLVPIRSAEEIYAEMKADLIARAPHLQPALEFDGDDFAQGFQVNAYREEIMRRVVNDDARMVMLAFSRGANLDHLGALMGVARGQLEDFSELQFEPNVTEHPELFEDDESFRARIQIALEGFTTAGSVGAYTFHATYVKQGEVKKVKDVAVSSPAPGEVMISVLSLMSERGEASQDVLDWVSAKVSAEDVRPLTDHVQVQSATIKTYKIEATIKLFEGPDPSLVIGEAQEAIEDYVKAQHYLGHDITLSGIYAALHQPNVHSVNLASPAASIVVAPNEAAFCTNITLSFGGRDV